MREGSESIDVKTRVVSGAGTLAELGQLTLGLEVRRVLLVTDEGVRRAGHAERGLAALESAGLEVSTFGDVQSDPTDRDAHACAEAVRVHRAEAFVALGGGSCIDAAKGANFLLTSGGEMRDYWGYGKATAPMLPLIAVPTTAGTGSEVQSFALIADAKTHAKMACGDRRAAPRIALLDPELTLSVPREVTAHTGMDALTHAVECAVTKTATPFSGMLAREAFRLGHTALARVMEHPSDLQARESMQWGACLAGMAIESSMLGAAHAMANPLTARFDLPHGQAVGLFLPGVVRFNAQNPRVAEGYRALAAAAGLCDASAAPSVAVDSLVARLGALLDATDMPRSITACGAAEGDVPALASEAAAQWTASHNPHPVAEEDLAGLYRAALESCR